MKHVDYLYFNIYNYFYRISKSSQSYHPRLQAMYLFSLGSGGWLLLFEAIWLHSVKHTRFASRGESAIFSASIFFLTTIFFNYIFITKDRDQKIYDKYQELAEKNAKSKLHLILSIIVLLLPYIALLSFAVFFPRHNQ